MNDEFRVERFPSGVAGLDAILQGGFIQGGIYLIQGVAGSGKTVLGNQLCCHRAKSGGKALYVTLLCESIDRMLFNIGSMAFFDPALIPNGLSYVSGLGAFEAEGLKGLLELIRRELRARQADILVIDGLGAAEEPASAGASIGEFTHQLQAQSNLLGCTTFVLSRGTHLAHTERAIVDGLIELTAPGVGSRRERRLELSVFRGGGHLRGQHCYEIGERGLRVYPRLEALLSRPADLSPVGEKSLQTGIEGLDLALGEHGLPAGSATLIEGPAGSGKTALALQFLSPCEPSERGVFVSFAQGAARAAEHARRIGSALPSQLERGAVQWLWRPAREQSLDALGHELLDHCSSGVTRVVIDGLDALHLTSAEPSRVLPFTAALLDELRARRITSVATRVQSAARIDAWQPPSGDALSSLFDALIELNYETRGGSLRRTLALLKAPGLPAAALGELTIGHGGVHVGEGRLGDAGDLDAALQVPKTTTSKPPARPRSVRRK